MMKYFTLLMMMFVPVMMMAQKPGDKERFNPEMHKLRQHAFMMEKAQFTQEDSARFFAIYDEMRLKERELYGNSRVMREKRPETDAECRAAMLHADSLELASKQLQYDYHQRLLTAVSPKKAVIAIMAGENFDRMTFRNMMRDWKRVGKDGMDDMDAFDRSRPKMGGEGKRHDIDGPHPDGPHSDGVHPHPDFHGGSHDGPGMEVGPDGLRNPVRD